MGHSSSPHDTEYSSQTGDTDSTDTVTLDAETYDEFMASVDPLLNYLYREGFSEQIIHLDELRMEMEEDQSDVSNVEDSL